MLASLKISYSISRQRWLNLEGQNNFKKTNKKQKELYNATGQTLFAESQLGLNCMLTS